MSFSEGLTKLVITIFFVPLPILATALSGFWLDYHKFNTVPLLSALGAVLGTLISFLGVYGIITYKHKRRD
jgi:uncharacterized membrane protein